MNSTLERLRRCDAARPGLPGEHWLALGVGLWLLTRPARTPIGRAALVAAGVACVWRAASGRDGLSRLLDERPWQRWTQRSPTPPHARFLDLSEPWPERERARIAAISKPISGAQD